MASRICPQCGQEAPQSAKFCPQCAAPFIGDAPTSSTATSQVYVAQRQKKDNSKVILMSSLGVGVLLLATAAVFALNRSTSVLHATSQPSVSAPPIMQSPAQTQSAPPIMQAPAQTETAPPVMQAPVPTAQSAPADVLNYLAFIESMEQSRSALEAAQTAAVLPLLGTANGLKTDMGDDDTNGGNTAQQGMSQINEGMTENLQKWQALIKQFQSVTPPASCEELGNSYYKLLNDYTDLCSQIQVALAKGDYTKVLTLQGAQAVVDQDAVSADGAVSTICTQYNIKKSFVISTSSGSGSTSLLGG